MCSYVSFSKWQGKVGQCLHLMIKKEKPQHLVVILNLSHMFQVLMSPVRDWGMRIMQCSSHGA